MCFEILRSCREVQKQTIIIRELDTEKGKEKEWEKVKMESLYLVPAQKIEFKPGVMLTRLQQGFWRTNTHLSNDQSKKRRFKSTTQANKS